VSPKSKLLHGTAAADGSPQLVAFPVLPAVVERRSRGWLPPLPDGLVSQLPRFGGSRISCRDVPQDLPARGAAPARV